jgi:transcriptional regulator NrdR family protein
MKCPFCQSENNKVIDTRRYDTCNIRIRVCENCEISWPTEEVIQTIKIDKISKFIIKLPT